MVKSFSYGVQEEPIIVAAIDIAQRERTGFSKVVIQALKEFVENHGEGNPQKPLFPSAPRTYHNPVTEEYSKILADLLNYIQNNPGKKVSKLKADFGRLHGRTSRKVEDYIKQLRSAGKISVRAGSKIYVVEDQTGEEVSPEVSWRDCQRPVTPDCQHCLLHLKCKRYQNEAP